MLIFVVEGVFSDDSSRPSSQGSQGVRRPGRGVAVVVGGGSEVVLEMPRCCCLGSSQVLLTVERLSSSKGVLVLGRKAVEWEWGIWMGSGGGHHRLL